MSNIIPEDEVEALEAALRAAEKWFGDAFRKATLTSEEQVTLAFHKRAKASVDAQPPTPSGLMSLRSLYPSTVPLSEQELAAAIVTPEIEGLKQRVLEHDHILDKAWAKLLNLMREGSLPSSICRDSDNKTEALSPDAWQAPNLKDAHGRVISGFFVGGHLVPGRAQIKCADLALVLAGKKVPQPIKKPKNAGGAPPKHDLQAFLIEAFNLIFECGPPKSRDELNRRARKAYKRQYPDSLELTHEWAKPIIRAVWDRLKLGK
jgi:hypothetical protein